MIRYSDYKQMAVSKCSGFYWLPEITFYDLEFQSAYG